MRYFYFLLISSLLYATCPLDLNGQQEACYMYAAGTSDVIGSGFVSCQDNNGLNWQFNCSLVEGAGAGSVFRFGEEGGSGTCFQAGHCQSEGVSFASSSLSSSSPSSSSSVASSSVVVSSSNDFRSSASQSWCKEFSNQDMGCRYCPLNNWDGHECAYNQRTVLEYNVGEATKNPEWVKCMASPACVVNSSSSGVSSSGVGASSESGEDDTSDATLGNQKRIINLINALKSDTLYRSEFRGYFDSILAQTDFGGILDSLNDWSQRNNQAINGLYGYMGNIYSNLYEQFGYVFNRFDEQTALINSSTDNLRQNIQNGFLYQENRLIDIHDDIANQASGLHSHLSGVQSGIDGSINGIHSHLSFQDNNISDIQNTTHETNQDVKELKGLQLSQANVTNAQFAALMSAFEDGSGGSSASSYDCAANFYFVRDCDDIATFETPEEYAYCCTRSSGSGSGGSSGGSVDCDSDSENVACQTLAETKKGNGILERISGYFSKSGDFDQARVEADVDEALNASVTFQSSASDDEIKQAFKDYVSSASGSAVPKFITKTLSEGLNLPSGTPKWEIEFQGVFYEIDPLGFVIYGKPLIHWLGLISQFSATIAAVFIIFG